MISRLLILLLWLDRKQSKSMTELPELIVEKIEWYFHEKWIAKGYATIHLVSIGKDRTDDLTAEQIEEDHPGFSEVVRRGDLIENVDTAGYRSSGVYMIDIANNQVIIRHLEYDYDDYGSPCEEFKCWTEFPIDYWNYDHMKVNYQWIPKCDRIDDSYWHDNPVGVVIDLKKMGLVADKLDWMEGEEDEYFTWIFRGHTYMIIASKKNDSKNLLVKGLKSDEPIFAHPIHLSDPIIKKVVAEKKIRSSDFCEVFPYC